MAVMSMEQGHVSLARAQNASCVVALLTRQQSEVGFDIRNQPHILPFVATCWRFDSENGDSQ